METLKRFSPGDLVVLTSNQILWNSCEPFIVHSVANVYEKSLAIVISSVENEHYNGQEWLLLFINNVLGWAFAQPWVNANAIEVTMNP
jgi:hypothetical protein